MNSWRSMDFREKFMDASLEALLEKNLGLAILNENLGAISRKIFNIVGWILGKSLDDSLKMSLKSCQKKLWQKAWIKFELLEVFFVFVFWSFNFSDNQCSPALLSQKINGRNCEKIGGWILFLALLLHFCGRFFKSH